MTKSPKPACITLASFARIHAEKLQSGEAYPLPPDLPVSDLYIPLGIEDGLAFFQIAGTDEIVSIPASAIPGLGGMVQEALKLGGKEV